MSNAQHDTQPASGWLASGGEVVVMILAFFGKLQHFRKVSKMPQNICAPKFSFNLQNDNINDTKELESNVLGKNHSYKIKLESFSCNSDGC